MCGRNHNGHSTFEYYQITLIAANSNCMDTTFRYVDIESPFMIYIPNTFTPNNDRHNDIFNVKGEGILEFDMKIFDRWGNLIFLSDDISKGWNGIVNGGGEVAQMDTYVYLVSVSNIKGNDKTYRGIVNLIR